VLLALGHEEFGSLEVLGREPDCILRSEFFFEGTFISAHDFILVYLSLGQELWTREVRNGALHLDS